MSDSVKIGEREFLKSDARILGYSVIKPILVSSALNFELLLLATPASSANSKRVFILLKLAVVKHKCNLKDDIVYEDVVLQ